MLSIIFLIINFKYAQAQIASINQNLSEVKANLNKVNQLANSHKIKEADTLLNETRRNFDTYITHYFDDEFRKARAEDPSYTPQINIQFSNKLTAAYWEDRVRRSQRSLDLAKEAFSEGHYNRTLDSQDKAWVYLKTTYDVAKTIKDVAENVTKMDYVGAVKSAKEGADGFVDNYKKIENAKLQIINTELYETEVKGLIRRGKKMEEANWQFASYMRAYENDAKDFLKIIDRLNNKVSAGTSNKLSYSDYKYNWDYEPFQTKVEEACKEFENYDIKCEDFKKTFNEITSRAREDWYKVEENIIASNDTEKKAEFLKYHSERWTEFLQYVDGLFKKSYDKYCGENAQAKNDKPEQKEKPKTDDVNDLFAGSTASVKAEPANDRDKDDNKKPPVKKSEPIKKTSSNNSHSNYSSTDKYWENYIPENSDKEWLKWRVGGMTKYIVRFQLNGRTVGYREYKDPNFKMLQNEDVRNNIAIKHGPYRQFNLSSDGDKYLSELFFFKANKKTGPKVNFKQDGSIRYLTYFIEDTELSEAEYKQKAKVDKSFAPYDIYKLTKWKEIPSESDMPNLPAITDSDHLGFNQLTIPSNAIKFIKIERPDINGIYYYREYYRLPNNTFEEVGERIWKIDGDNAVLRSEEIILGKKKIDRLWDTKTGELTRIEFSLRNESGKMPKVGPYLFEKKDYPADPIIETKYKNHNGLEVSLGEYNSDREDYPELPDPGIISALKTPTNISPNSYSDPEWVNQNVASMRMPSGSMIWKIDITKGVYVEYFKNHSIVTDMRWHDKQMTQPQYKHLKSYNKYLLSVGWFTNGRTKNVIITGRLTHPGGVRCSFNEDGSIKNYHFDGNSGKNLERIKPVLENYSNLPSLNSHLSPNLKSDMNRPKIPQAEITPLFTAIWGKDDNSINTNNIVVEQQQNQQNDTPTSNNNNEDEENYQQLQRKEFFELLSEVNNKLKSATKSFDKKWWKESQGPRATDNPKQESLDIMRQAVQIVKNAKYRENEGSLNHLIAYKLTDFSGRVHSYKAKEAFFLLAAQLINRSDQLISTNRFMQEKQKLSEQYCLSGEVWREMTRKASWGDHAYNKMACDKKVMQQYERAVQTDPNNQKAKRILEQLKAPKKPVPAAVQNFKEIEPESWNNAQTIMAQLDNDVLEQEEKITEHYSEIAAMSLVVGSGSVHVKKAGAETWEKITDSHVLIFENDMIKTSDDAKDVAITYSVDNTFFAIKPGSEVRVRQNHLDIKTGDILLNVTKKGTKFMVITPTCSVGVRGTQFEVNVKPDKTTETYLYEGVVETRNGNDIVYLVPGQKVIAKKGEAKLQQSNFNTNNRKATNWANVDNQRRQHEQIKSGEKAGKPSGEGSSEFDWTETSRVAKYDNTIIEANWKLLHEQKSQFIGNLSSAPVSYDVFSVGGVTSSMYAQHVHRIDEWQISRDAIATREKPNDVFALDQNNIWLCGDKGMISHSDVRGNEGSWAVQPTSTKESLQGIWFTDLKNGWAVGRNATILSTKDGGKTWIKNTSPLNMNFIKVIFTDKTTGYILADKIGNDYKGRILKTTNGGLSWAKHEFECTIQDYLTSMYFHDSQNGWICGKGGFITHTTNGGKTWTTQQRYLDGLKSLNDIHFRTLNEGWACGLRGLLYHTTNGGKTWTKQDIGEKYHFTAIEFNSPFMGWLATANNIYQCKDSRFETYRKDYLKNGPPKTISPKVINDPKSKQAKADKNTSANNSNSDKQLSPSDIWSLNTYNNDIESFKQNVTTKTNKGFVPVGLNCTNSQYEVLYLGGGVLSITAWNMEWYNDGNSLQEGINKNMNQGYFPSGFSWNGNAYYVFYIKTNFTGKAWQIVPSALDLNAVSTAIQPFVKQNYTPMGITIFGDEYYTLLVQFDTPIIKNWFIEGYNDTRSEIIKNINKKLSDGTVPWGILKSSGVANVLYIGM